MMQSMMTGKPTGMQVNAAFEHVKSMQDGDEVTHSKLASLMEVAKNTVRYRTLVNALKSRVRRELSGRLYAVRGVGYRKATGEQQLRGGAGTIRSGINRIRRGRQEVSDVSDERLPDPKMREARDHAVKVVNYLLQRADSAKKEVSLTVSQPDHLPRLNG